MLAAGPPNEKPVVAAAAREYHHNDDPIDDYHFHDHSDNEFSTACVDLYEPPGKLNGTRAPTFRCEAPKSYNAGMLAEHDFQMRAEQEAQAESVVEGIETVYGDLCGPISSALPTSSGF